MTGIQVRSVLPPTDRFAQAIKDIVLDLVFKDIPDKDAASPQVTVSHAFIIWSDWVFADSEWRSAFMFLNRNVVFAEFAKILVETIVLRRNTTTYFGIQPVPNATAIYSADDLEIVTLANADSNLAALRSNRPSFRNWSGLTESELSSFMTPSEVALYKLHRSHDR